MDYADIVFLIPMDSVDLFEKVEEFVAGLINTIRVEQNNRPSGNFAGSRIAIVQMGNNPRVVATLDQNINYQNQQTTREFLVQRLTAIKSEVQAQAQPSNLQAALSLTRTSVFQTSGDRIGARNVVFLIAQQITGGSATAIGQAMRDDDETIIMPIQYSRFPIEDQSVKQQLEAVSSANPTLFLY